MNAYDRLLAAGLERLDEKLGQDHVSAAEREEIVGRISRVSFPGLLGFAAAAKGDSGKLGDDLFRAAAAGLAEVAEIRQLGIEEVDLERLLRALLLHRGSPTSLLEDPGARRRILALAVTQASKEAGLGFDAAEARRVAELLQTGEFFTDVGGATAAVLRSVRGIPNVLVEDVRHVLPRAMRLPIAVLRDLSGAPVDAPGLAMDLLDGELDHPPAVMSHTLRALYDFATTASTVQMIRTLISRENETMRIAIVLHARANGIDVTPGDLDILRETAFDLERPDLGPALVVAWERLQSRVGVEAAGRILDRLEQRRP